MAEGFKWQEAYVRLERARRSLEASDERSPEDAARVLQDRARALARPLEDRQAPAEVLGLLVFVLAGERYAVESSYVREVLPLRGLTPMPCAPPVILGVLNYRGQILPVLDLRRLFDLAGQEVAEGSRVVAVEVERMTFGLFADAVPGITHIAAQQVGPPPAARGPGRQMLIRGVTGDMAAVLDLEALARHPQIVVNETVA